MVTSGGTPIAVPFDVSKTELYNVPTAAARHQLGLRSLDHTRRAYIESREIGELRFPAFYQFLLETMAEMKRLARDSAQRYHAIRDKPDRAGLFRGGLGPSSLVRELSNCDIHGAQRMHFEFGLVAHLILDVLRGPTQFTDCWTSGCSP